MSSDPEGASIRGLAANPCFPGESVRLMETGPKADVRSQPEGEKNKAD